VDKPHPRQALLIPAALFALYLIWGSTYFAMRVALRVLPPFLTAGPRYVFAGVVLFTGLCLRGAPLPTRKQWLAGGAVGILLLVFGNGFVVLAQRTIDSGVAATVVATMPLWAAMLSAALGDKPTGRDITGLGLGFIGTVVLQKGGSLSFTSGDTIFLLLAPVAWAVGSVLSRRVPLPPGTMSSAVQMLIAGTIMIAIGLVRGEHPKAPLDAPTIGALLYLALFGSVIAFSAYGFLLRVTRPAIATSYAYVNPVVALVIGALLGGERFTGTKLLACVLTIVGVLVVTYRPRRA
jgi:drug/metabolite transporter (DMT)-like permease